MQPSLPLPSTSVDVAHWRRIRGYFLLIMAPFHPEEDAAQKHQWSGILRVDELQRDTQFLAHPSVGGARSYDIHTSEMMVEMYKSGYPIPRTRFAAHSNGCSALCCTGWPGTSPVWSLLVSIYCCLFFSSLFGLTKCIMSASRLLPMRLIIDKFRIISLGLS